MGKRWNEFKRAVASPFKRKPVTGRPVRPGSQTAQERRRDHLRRQLTVIARDLLGLACAIAAERDPEDATAASVIRRGLVRARDLRYKASLLEAELDRESAKDAVAPRTRDEAPPPTAEVPRGVRRAAERARAAAEFDKRSRRAAFERALGDLLAPSLQQRRAAVETLQRLRSPAAVPLLKAALAYDDDLLRIKCLEALNELGAPCTLEEIGGLLISSDHRLRLAALRSLTRIATADAVPICIGCLTDRSSEVRRTAATMLGWVGARPAVAALAILLRDEAARVRAAAAESLGLLGSEQSIHALIRALGDEEIVVRIAAKAALDRILRTPIDIDVEQDAAALQSRVDALASWWIDARVSGEPWPVPGSPEHEEIRNRGKDIEVVPLFAYRGASRRVDQEAGNERKAEHGSS